MAEFELVPIHSSIIPAAWAMTFPYVEKLLSRSVDGTTPQIIFDALLSEELQLWHIVTDSEELRAIWITEIYTDRSGRKVLDWFGCAGDEASEWLHLREQIEQWAVEEHGATVAKITGRKGWERKLPDYKPTYVTYVKPLELNHDGRLLQIETRDTDDNVSAVGPDPATP